MYLVLPQFKSLLRKQIGLVDSKYNSLLEEFYIINKNFELVVPTKDWVIEVFKPYLSRQTSGYTDWINSYAARIKEAFKYRTVIDTNHYFSASTGECFYIPNSWIKYLSLIKFNPNARQLKYELYYPQYMQSPYDNLRTDCYTHINKVLLPEELSIINEALEKRDKLSLQMFDLVDKNFNKVFVG